MKNVFQLHSTGEEIEVEYFYTPGRDGCMYLSNGDPGYPPEYPETEVTKIILNGTDIINSINDDDFDILVETIEQFEQDKADYYDDCEEYL